MVVSTGLHIVISLIIVKLSIVHPTEGGHWPVPPCFRTSAKVYQRILPSTSELIITFSKVPWVVYVT